MKKILVLFLFALAGCSNFSNLKTTKEVKSIEQKEAMHILASAKSCFVSEEQMKADILSFISSGAEFRSVAANESSLKLKEKTAIKVAAKGSERTATADFDEIPIYIFDLVSSDGTTGYAVSTTDIRLGTVLAVSENGDFYAEEAKDFRELFMMCLENYASTVCEVYSAEKNESGYSRTVNPAYLATYEYSNCVKNSEITKCRLTTTWGQEEPYNNHLVSLTGIPDFVTGCVTTAIAQILAFHERPKTVPNGNKLITFDWKGMKEYPTADMLSEELQWQVSKLMADLCILMKGKYNADDGTGIDIKDAKNLLTALGFNYAETNYNYSALNLSIKQGLPVFIVGYTPKADGRLCGHAWVIDGSSNISCRMKVLETGEELDITDNFFHANLGWNGDCNGYYRAGIFNVNRVVAESDVRSTITSESESIISLAITALVGIHFE